MVLNLNAVIFIFDEVLECKYLLHILELDALLQKLEVSYVYLPTRNLPENIHVDKSSYQTICTTLLTDLTFKIGTFLYIFYRTVSVVSSRVLSSNPQIHGSLDPLTKTIHSTFTML